MSASERTARQISAAIANAASLQAREPLFRPGRVAAGLRRSSVASPADEGSQPDENGHGGGRQDRRPTQRHGEEMRGGVQASRHPGDAQQVSVSEPAAPVETPLPRQELDERHARKDEENHSDELDELVKSRHESGRARAGIPGDPSEPAAGTR